MHKCIVEVSIQRDIDLKISVQDNNGIAEIIKLVPTGDNVSATVTAAHAMFADLDGDAKDAKQVSYVMNTFVKYMSIKKKSQTAKLFLDDKQYLFPTDLRHKLLQMSHDLEIAFLTHNLSIVFVRLD